jgi:MFS family permease
MRLHDAVLPLRHTNFRRQFLAQAISMAGSTIAPVAMAFGVLRESGSPGHLGWVLAAYGVALLVFMPFGGVWADRLPRHRIMAASNLVRFATQATFGVLLIVGIAPLWAMMVLQAVTGAAEAFSTPAMIGLTAQTAAPGTLQSANALLAFARDAAGVGGPVLAGTLTETIGPGWALVFDGMSFLASAALLARLQLPPATRNSGSLIADVRAGWREVVSRDWLWSTIAYFAVFNLFYSVFLVLGPVQLAGHRFGALAWGAVTAALSIGMLCGNALAMRIMPHHLLRWPRVLELLAVPIIIALALKAPLVVLLIAAVLMGAVMTFPDALWFTALQQEIPEDAISRVSSFDHLGSGVLQPVGYSVGAVLAATAATHSLLAIAGIFVSVTLATLILPGVRNLERTKAKDAPESGVLA